MRARLSTATSMKPQEPRCATACASVDLQHLGQMKAVHLAGEPVEARQIGEPLFLRMPVVDDADDAVCARRLAVAAREPAANVLDPQRLLGAAAAAARTAPDTARPCPSSFCGDFITASKRLVAASAPEQLRVVAPARDRREAGRPSSTVGCIGAPGQHVGRDRPLVGRFADRRHDPRRIERGVARGCRPRASPARPACEHIAGPANTSALGGRLRLSGIPAKRVSRSCVTGEPFWDSRVAPLCDTAALIRR